MKRCKPVLLTFLSAALTAFTFKSCDSASKDLILAEVGHGTITLSEFESQFTRNSGGLENATRSTMEERERFLKLLVNYRLKVIDGYEKGYDKNPNIADELKRYRQSLASAYVMENEITRPWIDTLYQRRLEEVRARHILISVGENASAQDTLKAYEQATDIIKKLKSGEGFGELAQAYSADTTSGKLRGGDLYYFTTGMMVAPFEDKCYTLNPGEITQHPVRTRFGYHVIQVTDRRPNPGSIRVSHLYLGAGSNAATGDTLEAYERMKELRDSIVTGKETFAEIAKRYSQDRRTASQGGDLGFITRRSIPQLFDSVAFSLDVAEVSDIVHSLAGYHLLMVTDHKPVPSKHELESDLVNAFRQQRQTTLYGEYLERMKSGHGYAFHEGRFHSFLTKLDSTATASDSAWADHLSPDDRRGILVDLRPTKISVGDFVAGLSSQQQPTETPLQEKPLRAALDKFVETTLMGFRADELERTNESFRKNIQDFKDGSVLFEIEQNEIWAKLKIDEDSLRSYFDQHRDEFRMPERVKFREFFTPDKAGADSLYASLSRGDLSPDSVSVRFLRPSMQKMGGHWGLRSVDENDLTRRAAQLKVREFSEPVYYQGGYSIVLLEGREDARLKTYPEAASEVMAAVQDRERKRLEKEWLDRIRKKHSVELHTERLSLAFAQRGIQQ